MSFFLLQGPSVKLGLVFLLCVFSQIECQKKTGTRAKFSDLLEDMNSKNKTSDNDSSIVLTPTDVKQPQNEEDVKELEETVRSAQKDVKKEEKKENSFVTSRHLFSLKREASTRPTESREAPSTRPTESREAPSTRINSGMQ